MLKGWLKLKSLRDIDFYLVTYSSLSKNGTLFDVKNAVDAGCKIVQYREKNKSTRDMIKEAEQLKKLCKDRAFFLVDDRVDVALAVDADGVHLGQNDMPVEIARRLLGDEKIIGLTVHNVEEAVEAEKLGVDYVGLAPVFKTDTKEDSGEPCGVEMLKKIRDIVSVPIVAVGGINKDNVQDVISAGADGVVAVSSVLQSDDVYQEVCDFIHIIKEVKSL
ncbi:MAG: thiamine phosphate synthase [Thermoplasmata archaeon]|nr:MAG: thiamine phosphate synthase [Thermoplasmata archaeon]